MHQLNRRVIRQGTIAGVTAALGYEDHEQAPSEEMLLAAGRIARGVEVPVTVDAEACYGLSPAELVVALQRIGPQAPTSRAPTTEEARSPVRPVGSG